MLAIWDPLPRLLCCLSPAKKVRRGLWRFRSSAWQVAVHLVQLWIPSCCCFAFCGTSEWGMWRPTEARLLSRESHAALFHRETWTRRVFERWQLRQREQQEGRAAETTVSVARPLREEERLCGHRGLLTLEVVGIETGPGSQKGGLVWGHSNLDCILPGPELGLGSAVRSCTRGFLCLLAWVPDTPPLS